MPLLRFRFGKPGKIIGQSNDFSAPPLRKSPQKRSVLSQAMVAAVPFQVLCQRPEPGMFMEMQRPTVVLTQPSAMPGKLAEPRGGHPDHKIIPTGHCRPQSFVEHPVRIGSQCEAVLRIVVSGQGMLMNVCRLHE
jgi:hypothetical protein